MSKYLVTTLPLLPDSTSNALTSIRVLEIEAAGFELDPDTRSYKFLTASRELVASVPVHNVFAVIEEDALIADYAVDLEDEEDESDPETEDELYPLEKWKDSKGRVWWGFWTNKGFVNFSTKEFAEIGRQHQIEDPSTEWAYIALANGGVQLDPEDDSE